MSLIMKEADKMRKRRERREKRIIVVSPNSNYLRSDASKLVLVTSKRFQKGLLLHTIEIWTFCLDLGSIICNASSF